MGSRDCPQGDMLQVSKNSRFQRKQILKFVPPIGLTCINYRDLGEVDYLYLDCQNYRDYYRDSVNKLHPPKIFCQYHGKCGVRVDRELITLAEPVRWVREHQPVVYPAEYSRRMNLDGIIRIGAHFQSSSSVNFKR